MSEPIQSLVAGERVLVGGDRYVTVSPELAADFGLAELAAKRGPGRPKKA